MNRVVQFAEFGGPEVLQVVDAAVREPGPGQVRLATRFAGLNPVDYKIRRGAPQYATALPSGMGRELSGIVVATGPGVERLAAGDEVFGTIPGGALADSVVADEALFAFRPAGLPADVASGLALAGQTAWEALASQAVKPGDVVVVSASAGGVGGILSQLAVHAGARVIGTASPRNHGWLRSRGIEPVAYGPGLVDAVRTLLGNVAPTAAFDLNGPESVAQFLELGIPPERVNTNAMSPDTLPPGVRRIGRGPTDLATLGTLAALVVDGVVDVPIAATYDLDDIVEAYRFLEAGHLRGKVVVRASAASVETGTTEP